jgi:hypothetical protein
MLTTSRALYNGVELYPKVVWICFIVSESYLDIPMSPMQKTFFPLESSAIIYFQGSNLYKRYFCCAGSLNVEVSLQNILMLHPF